jgi:hypothetical protein
MEITPEYVTESSATAHRPRKKIVDVPQYQRQRLAEVTEDHYSFGNSERALLRTIRIARVVVVRRQVIRD